MSYKAIKEHQGHTVSERHGSRQNLAGLHSISFINVVTQVRLSTKYTESGHYTETSFFSFLFSLSLLYEGEEAKGTKKKKGTLSGLHLAQVNLLFIEHLRFLLCLHSPLKVYIAIYNALNAFKQWLLHRTRVKNKQKLSTNYQRGAVQNGCGFSTPRCARPGRAGPCLRLPASDRSRRELLSALRFSPSPLA